MHEPHGRGPPLLVHHVGVLPLRQDPLGGVGPVRLDLGANAGEGLAVEAVQAVLEIT